MAIASPASSSRSPSPIAERPAGVAERHQQVAARAPAMRAPAAVDCRAPKRSNRKLSPPKYQTETRARLRPSSAAIPRLRSRGLLPTLGTCAVIPPQNVTVSRSAVWLAVQPVQGERVYPLRSSFCHRGVLNLPAPRAISLSSYVVSGSTPLPLQFLPPRFPCAARDKPFILRDFWLDAPLRPV